MDAFELVASRLRAAGLALLALALAAVAGWLLTLPDAGLKARIGGWIALPFFGIGAVAAAVQVFRPSVLRLDRQGFELSTFLRRPVRTAWADIEPMFIAKVRRAEFVGYRYVPGRRPVRLVNRLNAFTGADGVMPNTFPMAPRDLVRLINDFREQAVATPR